MSLNKLTLPFLIQLYALSALASEGVTWQVEGREHSFYYDEKVKMVLSSACKDKACGAKTMIEEAQKISPEIVEPEATLTNPGSYYCRKLKAEVVMGKDQKGSQNAFCMAQDKTMVNLSSLGERK